MMKWIHGVAIAAVLSTGSIQANDQVRDLVLGVDREAIQVRQRAASEIQRQAGVEIQRLDRWIVRWEADAALAERLYDEALFALQSRVEGIQIVADYVKEVVESADHGVTTPVGVRSEKAITREANDTIRLIDTLKKEIDQGTLTLNLPQHGDTTMRRIYEQIEKARYDIERFQTAGTTGDIVIKFPGPLGRVDGNLLAAAIAERTRKIQKITARMDAGDFVVGGMPVLGMVSQDDIDARIRGVGESIQSAKTRLDQQQYFVFRHGLGQLTQRQLEQQITDTVQDKAEVTTLYGNGGWVLTFPGQGRISLQQLETSTQELEIAISKLEEQVVQGTLMVQLPGFAGSVDERGVAARLQALAGRTDAEGEQEQRKLQAAYRHIAEYARTSIALKTLELQRLRRLQALQEPIYNASIASLEMHLEDLRHLRPEFERDFREYESQQQVEQEWLRKVADYYLP